MSSKGIMEMSHLHVLAHVKMLIHGLMPDNVLDGDGHSTSSQWSFCMLLWILLLKDAQYKQAFGGSMERWLRVLQYPQTQRIDEQVSVEVEVASHPLL
jgi:hypothetical protein